MVGQLVKRGRQRADATSYIGGASLPGIYSNRVPPPPVPQARQASSMTPITGSLSVIIPAYNERDNITETVGATSEICQQLCKDHEYEIIIVDDGSGDDTYTHVEHLRATDSRIRTARYTQNQGKGFALRHGFQLARGQWVAFLDADLDLHPRHIGILYDVLRAEGADCAIGSKSHPDSRLIYPLYRKLLSTGYYWIIRFLFGLPVHDTQTGVKLFKRQVLEDAFPLIIVKRFAFDLELLVNVHRLGYRIVEAPVQLAFRRKFGRIGWQDVRDIWVDTMAVFYRLHILRYYDHRQEELRRG
ncbi:MAG: glycosyltransferase [Anaerolineae bacterium]|nr:glycosyltransferase [Anaerolineae bacterium]